MRIFDFLNFYSIFLCGVIRIRIPSNPDSESESDTEQSQLQMQSLTDRLRSTRITSTAHKTRTCDIHF